MTPLSLMCLPEISRLTNEKEKQRNRDPEKNEESETERDAEKEIREGMEEW